MTPKSRDREQHTGHNGPSPFGDRPAHSSEEVAS
jgi:hypothetical protein